MKAHLKSKGWNALHFALTFALICSVEGSTLVAENQNHAADFGQKMTDLTENRVVHDGYSLQCFSFGLRLHGFH